MNETQPDWETAQKIADLMLSLGKAGMAVYVEFYPVDPDNPTEYAFDYWEEPL